MKYALITGASMGLGRAIANELARRRYNLILASLPNEGVDKVAEECRFMGVECHIFEADLTNRNQLLTFCEEVNSNFHISVLVNNAGI